jgi:hypothetical protein
MVRFLRRRLNTGTAGRRLRTGTRQTGMDMKRAPKARDGQGDLPPAVERQINENLKLLYERQLQQDLPDRLKTLVAQLRNAEVGR